MANLLLRLTHRLRRVAHGVSHYLGGLPLAGDVVSASDDSPSFAVASIRGGQKGADVERHQHGLLHTLERGIRERVSADIASLADQRAEEAAAGLGEYGGAGHGKV